MKIEFLLAGLGVRVAGLIFQMFEVSEEVSIEILVLFVTGVDRKPPSSLNTAKPSAAGSKD
jgi:hypothetical protein